MLTPASAQSVRVALLLLAAIPGSLAGQHMSGDSMHIYRREGLWFNAGLGTGIGHGIGGQSANLALGWSLSPRVLVAVGSSDWRTSADRATLTLGTLDFRMQFYPELDGGFFLNGGLGLGYFWLSDSGSGPDIGRALLVGLGYDARISENVSITTFINVAGIHTPDPSGRVGQIGVGLTFH
jgi:hypothetical protein